MAPARRVATAFAVLSVLHVAAQLVGSPPLAIATKPLLMPALLWWVGLRLDPGRTRRWLAVALVASTAGDVLLIPGGEPWFLAGLGAFLVAQLAYVVTFAPWSAASVLGGRRWRALPYAVALVALLRLLVPGLGALAAPVVVYATVIMVMAAAATGVSRTTALGAGAFVVSDALIALTSLTELVALPRPGAFVMTTYLAGQALIVRGVVAAETARRDASDAAAGTDGATRSG